MRISRLRNIFGWMIAAGLLTAGYEIRFLWPLAIVGIAIFILRTSFCRAPREAFFGGWFVGAAYWALIARWLFAIWPAEWVGLERDPVALPLIFTAWVLLSAAMGSAGGLFGIAVFAARRRFGGEAALILVPAAWVLSEYSRAWFFSIFTAGGGALIGPHWTFGHLGYALVDSPFFALVPVAGVYGLSWLLAFAGAALSLFRKRGAVVTGAAVLAAALGISLLYRPIEGTAEPISVIVFQSDTRLGAVLYREAVRSAMEDYFAAYPDTSPDVIVLPEDSALFSISQEEEKELLARFFGEPDKQGAVVTNATVSEGGTRAKYAIFVDKSGQVIGRQPKSFLIPGGEFLPYVLKPVFWAFGRPEFAQTFRSLREISPGEREAPYVESGGVKFGAGICSGLLSPLIYREMTVNGAEVLLNQTSFSVFHGSPLLLGEMTRMARFRAAENARPLIQSANAGYSLVIDGRGKIVARPERPGNYLIAAEVTPGRAKTPFQRFGDWPVGASAALALAALGFGKRFIRSE